MMRMIIENDHAYNILLVILRIALRMTLRTALRMVLGATYGHVASASDAAYSE